MCICMGMVRKVVSLMPTVNRSVGGGIHLFNTYLIKSSKLESKKAIGDFSKRKTINILFQTNIKFREWRSKNSSCDIS